MERAWVYFYSTYPLKIPVHKISLAARSVSQSWRFAYIWHGCELSSFVAFCAADDAPVWCASRASDFLGDSSDLARMSSGLSSARVYRAVSYCLWWHLVIEVFLTTDYCHVYNRHIRKIWSILFVSVPFGVMCADRENAWSCTSTQFVLIMWILMNNRSSFTFYFIWDVQKRVF
jgi:hypothetical protein